MTIGESIRRERAVRGWTQLELSRRADINFTSISYYETGRSLPSTLVLIGIADAFGISLDQLVGRKVADGSAGT